MGSTTSGGVRGQSLNFRRVSFATVPGGLAWRSYAERMDGQLLDAYSRAVIDVVERVSPSVANLRVRLRSRSGVREASGAAVAVTEDRLVTNAHVVPARTRGGWASFPDASPSVRRACLTFGFGSWATASRNCGTS